jgi:drug/metabolite transporter (DMT)-like permease
MQIEPEILLGIVTGISGSALYAVSIVIYKLQGSVVRPIAIGAIKLWISVLFMAIIVFLPFRGNSTPISVESAIFLSISVLCAVVIGDTLYLYSHERIAVSHAYPIVATHPIFTYIMAILFLNELLLLGKLAGVLIAVFGIILVSLAQESSPNKTEKRGFDLIATSLALIVAILYAISATVLQIGVIGVDPIDANFVRVIIGSIAFMPIFLVARKRGMPIPPGRTVKVVAIASIFGMGLSSLLYVTTIKLVGAATTSLVCSTTPLFAIPLSVYYLKERVTKKAAIGVVGIILGIMLVVSGV